jgi:hypothetical protein
MISQIGSAGAKLSALLSYVRPTEKIRIGYKAVAEMASQMHRGIPAAMD